MCIRPYKTSDLEALSKLFHITVHSLTEYNQPQLKAWSPNSHSLIKHAAKLEQQYTLVSYNNDNKYNNEITGFGSIHEDYLDFLYVHKNYKAQGIGSSLLQALEAKAISHKKIWTEVSLSAKDFFVSKGYKILREQQVIRHEQALTNLVMEKFLL